MTVVAGHKGKRSFVCRVHGRECHSALAEGVNAVEAAAEMIARMKAIQRRLRRDGPFDAAYDPPYSTVHTGTIEGGRALNIVPAHCQFEFEIRALPLQDPDLQELNDWTPRVVAKRFDGGAIEEGYFRRRGGYHQVDLAP